MTTDLKRILERKGLTLKQVSILSGVSISTISRLARGEITPLHTTAEALEKALGQKIRFQRVHEAA